MEQPALALEHPGQLVVENLRIKLSGNAEARRVVQDRVDRGVRQRTDPLRNIGLLQIQCAACLG
ncbi:hypothetical protein D3C83_313240 [compost metagenome]